MAKSKPVEKIKRPKSSKASKKSVTDAELVAARATIAKLQSTVGKLEKKVEKLEKKSTILKAESKKPRDTAATTGKKAKAGGTAKVKKAKATVDAVVEPEASAPAESAVHVGEGPVVQSGPTDVVATDEQPASNLTVAQLRAAARAQGIPGYSRLRKDQLIAALA